MALARYNGSGLLLYQVAFATIRTITQLITKCVDLLFTFQRKKHVKDPLPFLLNLYK